MPSVKGLLCRSKDVVTLFTLPTKFVVKGVVLSFSPPASHRNVLSSLELQQREEEAQLACFEREIRLMILKKGFKLLA